MLLPSKPRRSNSVTVVPSGATSEPTRSPTNVWSRPTSGDATAGEQDVPSIEKVARATLPTPLTASGTLTPASLASGIATAGPV